MSTPVRVIDEEPAISGDRAPSRADSNTVEPKGEGRDDLGLDLELLVI